MRNLNGFVGVGGGLSIQRTAGWLGGGDERERGCSYHGGLATLEATVLKLSQRAAAASVSQRRQVLTPPPLLLLLFLLLLLLLFHFLFHLGSRKALVFFFRSVQCSNPYGKCFTNAHTQGMDFS